MCASAEPTDSIDTVVDFGVIHHVPDWQQAVLRIARVLRADGLLLIEEVPRRVLDSRALRTFTQHPCENRFESAEFAAELAGHRRHGIARIEQHLGPMRSCAPHERPEETWTGAGDYGSDQRLSSAAGARTIVPIRRIRCYSTLLGGRPALPPLGDTVRNRDPVRFCIELRRSDQLSHSGFGRTCSGRDVTAPLVS